MIPLPNDGGPAFPRFVVSSEPGQPSTILAQTEGMALRDYYAGQAMAAILASPSRINGGDELDEKIIARLAVTIAEALLTELRKRQ